MADLVVENNRFRTYPGSPFQLYQPFEPAGDQPEAIVRLRQGIDIYVFSAMRKNDPANLK